MAEETINIKLQTELNSAKSDVQGLKDKGATKNVQNSERDFNELIKTLEALVKVTDPTKQQLREIKIAFKQLNELIKKVSDTVRTLTPELKELEKQQTAKQKQLDKANTKLEQVQAKGTETGRLRKSYIEQQIQGVTYAGGNHAGKQVGVDAFMKNGEKGDFSKYSDPEGAKKVFEQLQKTSMGLADEYKKAQTAIETLKKELAAINEKVNAASTTGDNATHARASERDTNVSNIVQNEVNMRNIQESSGDATVGINNTTAALNKQSTALGKAFRQLSIYAIAYRMVRKAIREAIKTIKELDRSLTEQAMVTGLTRKQTYGLLKDYQNMASNLGATTKEVSSTMTQFLRQGRSVNESLKLTEAAISAAKVAGIAAADSINYLTTAINGFRLSANDAMKVSDKFAAVAASAATSYEEIAIALSKVAAQANLAGMSIDYTTALLTKGIETTREAPETIGTALKTVIARMRELGDYGETLEGDVDINNVEAQLSYIGIALRDNNGELRSTEEVLNELGQQWDDLNANQQAAIAKALAGTRQQSRLIAMMSDYKRVIELQEIAERSQGATIAQMGVYLEGMDAALNRVSVAWEKIVSSITDSEMIIQLVNSTAAFLDNWGAFLETNLGIVTLMGTIAIIGLTILGQKMAELMATRQQNALTIDQRKNLLAENKLEEQKRLKKIQTLIKDKEATVEQQKKNVKLAKELVTQTRIAMKKGQATKADLQAAKAILKEEQAKLTADEKELTLLKAQEIQSQTMIGAYGKQEAALKSQGDILGKIASGFTALIAPIMLIKTLIDGWNAGLAATKIYQNAVAAGMDKAAAKEARNVALAGSGMFAHVVSAFASLGPWGVALGVAAGIALLAAVGLGIAASVGAFNADKRSEADKTADQVNELSNKIYDLQKRATAVQNVVTKFDALDKKVLKTNKDLEEMSSILESAADSLTDEQKDIYNGLSTEQAKKEYLENLSNDLNAELSAAREEQRKAITKLRANGGENWNKFLTSNDSKFLQARDAMYALNNAALYKYIDNLKDTTEMSDEAAQATSKLTQSILERVSAEKAAEILADQGVLATYADAIAKVQAEYKDSKGETQTTDAASILTSDSYTITERVNAFRELRTAIAGIGDDKILSAFEELNSSWKTFSTLSDNALEYIDKIGADIDGINELASAIQKLGYDTEESVAMLNQLFDQLDQGADLRSTISDFFGEENYDDILNAFDKAFGTTILNMGQNVTKFKNTINSFYEKAKEWSSMSEADKTSFISENGDLFKGDTGAALLEAFESGNYTAIATALSQNEALIKQRTQLLKDVNQQLQIELARSDEERNEAYIKELQEYKQQLEDVNNLYLASLKLRYEQQQAQLDAYKEMLQKETDALTEALDKRKEAYQKYFDTINQEEETEDFEEKVRTLTANIAKLGSSQNADAVAKTADLTKQLEDLQKDRLKELRQQAQEAVVKSIEDEVSQINDNLEKLLNNEQALLNAMMNDVNNPSQLIASLMSAEFASGNNTELGMQSYLQQMQSTFASIMPGVDWSAIDVENRGDSLILNIMGKEIQLTDTEQQTVYDAIQDALRQLGYN